MKTFLDLLRHSLLAMIFHVAPRFANVLIFILIGRLAGPDFAGVFSLATTYLLISTTLMRGLDDLVTRQVAREPDRAAHYLGNFLLLRLTLAMIVYGVLIAIVQNGLNYPAATRAPIVILALSVLPDSLAFVAQAVLLGQRRFGPPAAIHGATNTLKLLAGTTILLTGGGLIEIAWVWLGGSVLGLVLMLIVAFRQVGGVRQVRWLDFAPLKAHWQAALTFTAITSLTALDSQTDTVLLSVFRTEAEIGWYGAATTVTFSLVMLSQAYRFAVYPQMTRYAQNAPEKLAPLFQKSVHYMTVLVMPMVAGLILVAPQIVDLVFGPRFAPTGAVLRVLACSLLFIFVGEPINRLMLVKDKQQVLVMLLLVGAVSNVALNLLLIPSLGAVGAAIARTSSVGLYFTLNCLYLIRNRLSDIKPTELIKPGLATLVMSMIIWLTAPDLMISIILGLGVYTVTLLALKGIPPEDMRIFKQYALGKLARSGAERKT